MPIQYIRNNNDNLFYKSINNKSKNEFNNLNKTVSNINTKYKNEFEDTNNNNKLSNMTVYANKIHRENPISKLEEFQEHTPNIIKFNKKENFESINKKNFNDDESINENKKNKSDKNIFSKSNVKFKKIDNHGLEYFKLNPKSNIKFENLINSKIQNDKKVMVNYDVNKANNYNNDNNVISHKAESKSFLVLLKNHGLQYNKIIMNSHVDGRQFHELGSNQKLINKKMTDSDVFFLKENSYNKTIKTNNNENINLNYDNLVKNYNILNESIKKENFKSENYKKIERHKYVNSDIFSLKNDQTSLNKIGEKYLFRENNSMINSEEFIKAKFNSSSRSRSEWAPKNNITSLMNHESTNYDFFNSKIKKRFLTKANITNMANGFNPNKIQKSISEILDLNRVGVPNSNKVYVKAFEDDKNVFKRKNNVCQDFSNLYKKYQNLCEKPFVIKK